MPNDSPDAAKPVTAVPPVGHRRDAPDTIAPDGSEIRLLLGADHGATQSSLCEARLPAGQVSRPVWHRTIQELWYIVAGRGQVWRCPPTADPQSMTPVDVGPGDALTIPTGWWFQFQSAPDEDLRFLCLTVPAWPGDDEALPAPDGGLGPATV